jgi:ActR/RegA family two-component response regulator
LPSTKKSHRAAADREDSHPLPQSELRRIHIRRILETCHGNCVRAARMLGIRRTSIYRSLKSSGKQSGRKRSIAETRTKR